MSRVNTFIVNIIKSNNIIQTAQFVFGLLFAVLIAYLLATDNLLWAACLLAFPIIAIIVHRYPFISIMVWLLLSPFLTFTKTVPSRMLYWGIHRALPPATIIVIIIVTILMINKRRLPKLGFAELSMLGYVVVSILSIYLLNPSPQATFYLFYDRVISPMFLYLVIRLYSPNQKDIQVVLPIVFFIAVSQSIFGMLSWAAPGLLPKDWLGLAGQRTTGSLVNTTVYTATLMFSGLILLQAGLNQRSRVVRNIFIAAFIMCLISVFLSFSRASWLGGVVVLIGLAFLYPNFIIRMSTTLVIISLLFGAVISVRFSWVFDWANERLYSEQATNSALSRLPVFYAAVRMFAEKPVFGWGYGNFDLYDRQYQAQIEGLVGDDKDHASHNFFLTLIAEQGAVGFLLFTGPVFYWLGQTIKKAKRMPSAGLFNFKLPIMLWLVMLNEAILVNFSNLRVVFGWGIWWVTLGMIAAMVSSAPRRARERTTPVEKQIKVDTPYQQTVLR